MPAETVRRLLIRTRLFLLCSSNPDSATPRPRAPNLICNQGTDAVTTAECNMTSSANASGGPARVVPDRMHVSKHHAREPGGLRDA